MMICNADFEELFPDLFQPEHALAARTAKTPSAECIARWEDDGGLQLTPNWQRRTEPRRVPTSGYDVAGFARAGAIVAATPAIATNAAISTMFLAYD